MKPDDLAGRIRALVHAWTDEWLKAEGDDATIVSVILGEFRHAHTDAFHGFSTAGHVDYLRRRARSTAGHPSWSALYSRAADEIEAILREHAEGGAP